MWLALKGLKSEKMEMSEEINCMFDRQNCQRFLNKMKTQGVATVKFSTYSLLQVKIEQ